MKILLLLGLMVSMCMASQAQTNKKDSASDDNDVFCEITEVMPEFPGGDQALMNYFNVNLRYPQVALENGISGTVLVAFAIDTLGVVSDVKVDKGVDPLLDQEAIRLVKGLPNWKPARKNGKPVKSRFRVPVRFRLDPVTKEVIPPMPKKK